MPFALSRKVDGFYSGKSLQAQCWCMHVREICDEQDGRMK